MRLSDLQRLELRNQTLTMRAAAEQAPVNYRWAMHGYCPIEINPAVVEVKTSPHEQALEEPDALNGVPEKDHYGVLLKEMWCGSLGEIAVIDINPQFSVLHVHLQPLGMSEAQRFLWFGYVNPRKTPVCCPGRVEYVCDCAVPHLSQWLRSGTQCQIAAGTWHIACDGHGASVLAHELADYARANLVAAAGAATEMLFGDAARARECPSAFTGALWDAGDEVDLFEYAAVPVVFAGVRFDFEA
jgi:hypothetical protein